MKKKKKLKNFKKKNPIYPKQEVKQDSFLLI